ncbi:Sodium/potassium/calcium exchanger 2 [Wickerhamomyces ciferrii]|uniref:Sodium/potassium/calcium exchanger 2 n=1 Tax=Wickerhamomyces ciferrii (strain ATCC 14091 / BCRC 22168 / CBS 111 / JCM 3599 / NBRC 0793 / NRRL Y-1031 F-60-10) TaxID=1206466 RepID=K0KMX4_WICCF|nr:Sodium/potassium/calcium exchanger 2 [Wickerhamomyces ciferrii]CCH42478.1 Sodium/potassium/calcium exchanger 2 [Wickerhamomyces ciferrii]
MSRNRTLEFIKKKQNWLYLIYLFPSIYIYIDSQYDIAINQYDDYNTTDISKSLTCDVSNFTRNDLICDYISENCDLAIFNHSKQFYCSNSNLSKATLIITISIIIILIFITFGLITSNFLYPNLDLISQFLNISNRISGLTLLSLGNATPDFFSIFNAFNSNSNSLAMGELIGSVNFVIVFIIGSMGVMKPFKVNHGVFLKDLIFFSLLIGLAIFFIQDSKLYSIECGLMILLYIGYVNYSIFFTNEGKDTLLLEVVTNDEEMNLPQADHHDPEISSILSTIDDNKTKGLTKFNFIDAINIWKSISRNSNKSSNSLERPNSEPIQPQVSITQRSRSESEPLLPKIHHPKPIHIPPIILETPSPSPSPPPSSPKLLDLLLSKDPMDPPSSILIKSTYPILIILNLIIPVLSNKSNPPNFLKFKQKLLILQSIIIPWIIIYQTSLPWTISPLITIILFISQFLINSRYIIPPLGFITSILIIIILSTHLINLLKNIGTMFKISETLLGLTILALGNSMGDLISNLTLAELDLSIVGINACFGSPLIYILLGVGINGLIINFQHGEKVMDLDIDLQFKISCLGLFGGLIVLGLGVPINGWWIDRKIGIVCILWWCLITGLNIYYK